MRDIRRPQTPLFWVFHLLSANERDKIVPVSGNLSMRPNPPMSRIDCNAFFLAFVLQNRDDHHLMNRECHEYPKKIASTIYFLRKEQPSVRRALPPVGWHRTVVHPWQMTTVWACEKTVVMVKHPGHLTSMKKDRGPGTRVCTLR